MEIEKIKRKFLLKWHPHSHLGTPKARILKNDLDTLLDKIIQEQVSKDRIIILTSIAMELWYKEKESEDYSLAFSFDENGIPNSVSLEIYGRTHSEITIPDYKLKE